MSGNSVIWVQRLFQIKTPKNYVELGIVFDVLVIKTDAKLLQLLYCGDILSKFTWIYNNDIVLGVVFVCQMALKPFLFLRVFQSGFSDFRHLFNQHIIILSFYALNIISKTSSFKWYTTWHCAALNQILTGTIGAAPGVRKSEKLCLAFNISRYNSLRSLISLTL